MVTRSGSGPISWAVDQMVVSVGPYTFTSRPVLGRSRRANARGSASPPTRAVTSGTSKPLSRSIAQPVGVACTWVTACRAARALNCAPSRVWLSLATTTVAPVIRGRKSSRPEMSKDTEVSASQVSAGRVPRSSRTECSRLVRARCSIWTPLGRPVEPEV